jgi:tetratricopeptide (TPR) repeat protein
MSSIAAINKLDKRRRLLLGAMFILLLITSAAALFFYIQRIQAEQKSIALEKSVSSLRLQAIKAEADGDFDKADSLYAQALADAETSGSSMKVIEFLSRLVQVKIKNHKLGQTDPLMQKAVKLALAIKDTPASDSNLDVWLDDMANAFYKRGENSTREDIKEFCLERYADIKLSVYDRYESFPTARANMLLSRLRNTERYAEALPYEEKACSHSEHTMGNDLGFVGYSYWYLGIAYLSVHKTSEAEAAFRKFRELHKKHGTPDGIVEGTLDASLGNVQLDRGDLKGAMDLYQKAIASDKRYHNGKPDVSVGKEETVLGILEMRAEQYGAAIDSFQEALKCLDQIEKATVAKRPDSGLNAGQVLCCIHLSQIASTAGKKSLASSLRKRAQDICSKNPQWLTFGSKSDFNKLENFFILRGDFPSYVDMLPTHIRLSE